MSKHTPGPWHVETKQTSCGVCHKVGPFPAKREGSEPRHACLYADYPSRGNPADIELAANARLIAAAPDLLAALDLYVKHYGDPLRCANAAIAKATGETNTEIFSND